LPNASDPALKYGITWRELLHKVCAQSSNRTKRRALRAIQIEQYREELKARDRFLRRFPSWTRQQLRNVIGQPGIKGNALIDRWIRSGKILRVKHHGRDFFPQFQFKEGRRLLVFKHLLRVMRNTRSDWEIAHWMVASNGWFPISSIPLEVLYTMPELVLDAALQWTLPNYG
jgi:hypothetical protein